MKFHKPNFDFEWGEALRYREFEDMGKDAWIKLAKDGYIVKYSEIKDVLGNVDLDFDTLEEPKKERFQKSIKIGKMELPIVVKFSDEDYDLIAGNTRLSGLIGKGVDAPLWVVDLTKIDLDEECWKGYKQVGGKIKNGKQVPNCVPTKKSKTDESANPAQQAAIAIHKKEEAKEETMTGSSGSFEAPLFSDIKIVKRPITKIHNANLSESEEDIDEAMDSSSSGQFDVPAFGKTTKGGRRDPLKIDGPKSVYKGRAVTDKKFPKWGGPGGLFVKIKDKCKKFPYCNQGNTGALEFIKEDSTIKDAITEVSKKYGIPYGEIEKIVINDISKIFI